MYLLDSQNQIVDAECSFDIFEGSPCVVVESSGGANPARGVKRRNPDYNKLLSLLFERLAASQVQITNVLLDSSRVADLPVEERIAKLAVPYPVNLSTVEIDDFRKMLQHQIALMHRDPNARKGGNAQKKIRICLNKPLAVDHLISQPHNTPSPAEVPLFTPGLNETEKEYISTARLGQGQFRKDLVKAYKGRCPITGIENDQLLVASHIKPWKVCTNSERLDPQNGILLSALIDKLFDKGLITFSNDGRIVISPTLSRRDRSSCGLDEFAAIQLPVRSRHYMEYHRAVEFKRT